MALIENNFSGPKTGLHIDSKGRARTFSISSPVEEDAAENGVALIFHAECHTAAAASGGLMSIKNVTADKQLHFSRVYIRSFTITPTDLVVTASISPTATITNGTDASSTAIIQKNTAKATPTATSTATITVSDASADMTFSGATQHHSLPMPTMTEHVLDLKGTNVLAPGGYLVFGWKTAAGGNATDAEIVSISADCYLEDVGHD